MKNRMTKSILTFFLCFVLIAVTALSFTGCNAEKDEAPLGTPGTTSETVEPCVEVGEGKRQFTLTVTYDDGSSDAFLVNTDRTVVADALTDLGLIDGEYGDFGLYVTSVNGVEAKYETDGTYWAFYVNGEYATSGVGNTEIVPGAIYGFKVEK